MDRALRWQTRTQTDVHESENQVMFAAVTMVCGPCQMTSPRCCPDDGSEFNKHTDWKNDGTLTLGWTWIQGKWRRIVVARIDALAMWQCSIVVWRPHVLGANDCFVQCKYLWSVRVLKELRFSIINLRAFSALFVITSYFCCCYCSSFSSLAVDFNINFCLAKWSLIRRRESAATVKR